jgi:chloramphenicol O-acetyltransferase
MRAVIGQRMATWVHDYKKNLQLLSTNFRNELQCPYRPFQNSLMFASKVRCLNKGASFTQAV